MHLGENRGAALPLHVSPVIIHSCVGQLMNFKTFIKHLYVEPHTPFLLSIDTVRPYVGVGRRGGEMRKSESCQTADRTTQPQGKA